MSESKKLKEIYKRTTFYVDSVIPEWDGLKFIPNIDEDGEEREYPHVGECSHLGDTLIELDDTYEGSGDDCFFIQELIRLYAEGKLKVIEPKDE